MEYYYFLNGTQYGPMPVEAMVSRIDRNTLVWRQGMENWLPAGSLPELAPFLAQQVQPPQMNNVKLRDFSKTTKVFSIFGVIFSSIMLLISIVFISEPDRRWDYYYDYYYYGVDEGWGVFYFLLSVFLLVFSIIALAKASGALRKKRQQGYR